MLVAAFGGFFIQVVMSGWSRRPLALVFLCTKKVIADWSWCLQAWLFHQMVIVEGFALYNNQPSLAKTSRFICGRV